MTPDNYVKVRIGGGGIDIAKRFCFVELKHGEPLSQQYRKSRYSLSSASEEFSGSTEHDTFSNRELLERAKQHRLETKLSENIGDVLATPLRRRKKEIKKPGNRQHARCFHLEPTGKEETRTPAETPGAIVWRQTQR